MTPGPDPLHPGWHAKLQHPDHLAAQIAAEAERRAPADKPAPRKRTRTRKAAE